MSILEKSFKNKKICIDHRDSFIDMAFDGCYYYFLSCHCPQIEKYNKDLEKVCCKPTCMKFNSICYDHELNCFWATTQCCYKKIFKLDACLNMVGCIYLVDTLLAGCISGISYNCCNDKLILSYPHSIYSVNKTTGETQLIYENENICITGVLALCPGYVITYIKDGKEYVLFYKNSSTEPVIYDVPNGVLVKSIVYNPCHKCQIPTLDMFYYNCHCCPYLIRIPLPCLSLNFTPEPCNELCCRNCPDSNGSGCGCGCGHGCGCGCGCGHGCGC